MTRDDALATARKNYTARMAAMIEADFRNGPALVDADFGFRHGWYAVGGFNFNEDEVTGVPYDITQGGWAYL